MSINAPRPTLLVTGAAGFIGSRFVASCNKLKIPVVSVDKESHFHDRPEHHGIDFGRIIDRDALFATVSNPKAWDELGVGAIIHLGACTDTMEFDVAYLSKMNVDYSKSLWKLATDKAVPLVYASSAATYGGGEHGYDDDESELTKLKPLNPYGQSKHDFDLWALAEERAGRKPPAWSAFKFFNVYGFGERHKGKMASVILHGFDQIRAQGWTKLFKSHKEGIADGHQKRDFVFVDDLVHVLHFAAAKPISRGIFNLGSGKARTFLDLTRAVFNTLGKTEDIRWIDTPVEIRDKYQYFTEAKMEKLKQAGYPRPFTSLEEGVAAYIAELSSKS